MTRDQWAKRPRRSSKWISKARRLAIYLRDGFACVYCGRDLRDAKRSDVTLDHLRAQIKNGTHETRNLVTACARCNCGRHERPWWTFATPGAVARIKVLRRRAINLPLAQAIIRGDTPPCEMHNTLDITSTRAGVVLHFKRSA